MSGSTMLDQNYNILSFRIKFHSCHMMPKHKSTIDELEILSLYFFIHYICNVCHVMNGFLYLYAGMTLNSIVIQLCIKMNK